MAFCVESSWYIYPLGEIKLAKLTMLQSKDKFLSAAASDGFGFCSVVLCVSFPFVETLTLIAYP